MKEFRDYLHYWRNKDSRPTTDHVLRFIEYSEDGVVFYVHPQGLETEKVYYAINFNEVSYHEPIDPVVD